MRVPKTVRSKRARVAVLAAAAAVTLSACFPPAPGPGPARADSVVADLLTHHQIVRATNLLPGFGVDPGMNANAQFHAERLASGAGCNLWHSSELGGWYAGFAAAENVACWNAGTGVCPADGSGLMSAWLNSPPHLQNILNGGYAWIGIGAACSNGRLFAVAHFRSP
jgi:uncharacterized protein YkwD